MPSLAKIVKKNPLLRAVLVPLYRASLVLRQLWRQARIGILWLFRSRETTNFTFPLTDVSRAYLLASIGQVTGLDLGRLQGYLGEIESDPELREHIRQQNQQTWQRFKADAMVHYHKRLGWYVMARALKPRVVVETGVDKGMGSVVLCSALLRNKAEGSPGEYFGTDINPDAGYLLCGQYAEVGRILYGDSLESLGNLGRHIDLFINDSDHSADYEAAEYEKITSMLAPGSMILGDNCGCNDRLFQYSVRNGRNFLYWNEEPAGHWYKGDGIGFSWKSAEASSRTASV